MTFEQALIAMRQGKKIKLPERNFNLCLMNKIYYDGDENRPAEIIASSDIVRTDWEIVE